MGVDGDLGRARTAANTWSGPGTPAIGAGRPMVAIGVDLDLGSGCTLIAWPPRRGR